MRKLPDDYERDIEAFTIVAMIDTLIYWSQIDPDEATAVSSYVAKHDWPKYLSGEPFMFAN